MSKINYDRENSSEYKAPRLNCTITDFDICKRLGGGSCSTVIEARLKSTGDKYAIKMVDKNMVIKNKLTAAVSLERRVLDKMDYIGIAKLYFTFQDQIHIYYGLELCEEGELFDQILEKKKFEFPEVRFYAAEILQILEYLRSQNIIHRDIKPENLLLDENGHLKLIDFGCVKDLSDPNESTQEEKSKHKRRVSFVGTADYVAPETLENTEVSFATDLWSFGCVIYQMLTGKCPFRGGSEYLTYENISNMKIEYTNDIPDIAKDLIYKLLKKNPALRIGANDLEEVKRHEFFDGIDWIVLRNFKSNYFIKKKIDPELDALDWDLQALTNKLPIKYDFIPYNSDDDDYGYDGGIKKH